MTDAPTPYEEWKVIDRWWTEEPETRYYRDRDGIVEVRTDEDSEWRKVDLAEHELDDERADPSTRSGT